MIFFTRGCPTHLENSWKPGVAQNERLPVRLNSISPLFTEKFCINQTHWNSTLYYWFNGGFLQQKSCGFLHNPIFFRNILQTEIDEIRDILESQNESVAKQLEKVLRYLYFFHPSVRKSFFPSFRHTDWLLRHSSREFQLTYLGIYQE